MNKSIVEKTDDYVLTKVYYGDKYSFVKVDKEGVTIKADKIIISVSWWQKKNKSIWEKYNDKSR